MTYRYLISIFACTAALTLSACDDKNNDAAKEADKPAASIDTTIEGSTEGIATTDTDPTSTTGESDTSASTDTYRIDEDTTDTTDREEL